MVTSKGCKPSLLTLEFIFELSSKAKHLGCYSRVEKIASDFNDADTVNVLLQKYPKPETDGVGSSIPNTNSATEEENASTPAITAEIVEQESK